MSDRADRISMEASEWLIRLREAPDDTRLGHAFAAWRDADPDHERVWGEVQAIFELIGHVEARYAADLAPMTVTPSATLPPTGRLGRARRFWSRDGKTLWKGIVAGAVAACLAILIGPALLLRMQADHMTSAGQLERITLDDGSQVRLGPDSAIAVAYSAGHRDIRLLKGQAWFEVRPDRARPFQVQADRLRATALGTAFDVRMIGTDHSVAVGHGRVRIDGAGDGHATQIQPMALLNAGDWVDLMPDRRVVTGHQASNLAGIWQTGSIIIRGRTVKDAIEELRPWYRGRIFLASDAIGAQRVTGIYRLSDPEDALRALVEPHGGRITTITPWVLIVS